MYGADIGSMVRGRFGWARSEEQDDVRSHRGGTEFTDGAIAWARFYLEPVEEGGSSVDEVIAGQFRPGRAS